jgi:hypothetical protein
MREVIGMRGVAVLSSLVLMAALLAAGAETVLFPLPSALNATYLCESSPSRTVEFDIDPSPGIIYSVSIRLTGETNVRQWFCDLDPPFDVPVTLYAFMPDPITGGAWYTSGVCARESGNFVVTLPFRPYWPEQFGQPTWDFLRAGNGSMTIYGGGAPVIDICWPIGDLSIASVSGASLLIDGEFAIPVEQTTWGRIKSIYSE